MTHDILIVNGSPSRRHSSRELLERAGYEVREIVSLDDALEIARHTRPLAVVIESPNDVTLPDRFAERLRRHPVTKDVPVIVLDPESDRARSTHEVPAVTWLTEPCPPRTFLDEVAYLTRPPKKPEGLFGAPPHD